jgi:hypothetical protein
MTDRDNFENRLLQGEMKDDDRSLQFVRSSLSDFIRLSKKYHFTFTLAAIPVAAQASNDYPKEQYQSTLKQFAQQTSLDFIDLLPTLRDYYKRSGKFPVIPFDGHYNENGTEIFGRAVVNHLRSTGSCGAGN